MLIPPHKALALPITVERATRGLTPYDNDKTVYARAYTCADVYHTRKAPIVAVSLTVIEVAKFCVAKNKRDKRFLYVICTRRFAHIGLRDDMQLQNYEK